ncbi:flagellar motor switch protein FliG [Litorimonas taeanensis]|uniref:Flagellar motor switch protein FliG n=1 Tax=Litorimonas taeanensis TaxID=568099 RepID=A0A420WMP1_9PROT|nr:FliG C-terminal domain-containing protein [Litorimonas taeanensis]RKQ72166.1 flagellar motor switch protein FliG [Litorimonas taeanensis]
MADQGIISRPRTNIALQDQGVDQAGSEISDITDLTDAQKAAIVIISMGQDYAAPIVDKLSDEHMSRFVRALEELREVPRPKMLAVIADFVVKLNGRKGMFRAGPEKAMEIARNVLDEERMDRLASQDPYLRRSKPVVIVGVWAELERRPTKGVSEFLLKQKTQVATYILSKLSNDVVTEILAEIPEDKTIEYIQHLSNETKVAPFVEEAIEKFVRTEFLEEDDFKGGSESVIYVADLMSSLDRDRRERILESIEAVDKARAKKIRDVMLTFDDLPERLPTSAISLIFKDYNKKDLINMLKAASVESQPVCEFFYSNISQRMADQIREEVDIAEDLNEKEAGKAISSFMSFLSGLEKNDRLTFLPKPVNTEEALSAAS